MGIAGGYYAGETITPGDCTEDRIRTLFFCTYLPARC